MQVVDFETAKILRQTFPNYRWDTDNCIYLYSNDSEKRLINWSSREADYYLNDNSRFYPAPFIQAVIEKLEREDRWPIYITPRFDGFDNAQIDTYFEIYERHVSGGRDYSSDAHVGTRFESANRAIREVCQLIEKQRANITENIF